MKGCQSFDISVNNDEEMLFIWASIGLYKVVVYISILSLCSGLSVFCRQEKSRSFKRRLNSIKESKTLGFEKNSFLQILLCLFMSIYRDYQK